MHKLKSVLFRFLSFVSLFLVVKCWYLAQEILLADLNVGLSGRADVTFLFPPDIFYFIDFNHCLDTFKSLGIFVCFSLNIHLLTITR